MLPWLPAAQQAEAADLARRYGAPLVRQVDDPRMAEYLRAVTRTRQAEVCMVIRRPDGAFLTMTKEFYPPGVFRLPTGGIEAGEGIEAALRREIFEETSLAVAVERFLAVTAYHLDGAPAFTCFTFLARETGGTLAPSDPHERVAAYGALTVADLPAQIARLAAVSNDYSDDLGSSFAAWGALRADEHRGVLLALQG